MNAGNLRFERLPQNAESWQLEYSSNRLLKKAEELVRDNGFVVIRNFPEAQDHDGLEEKALEIAGVLGNSIWQDESGSLIFDIQSSASSREFSGADGWFGQESDTTILLAKTTNSQIDVVLYDAKGLFDLLRSEDIDASCTLMSEVPFSRMINRSPGLMSVESHPMFMVADGEFKRARLGISQVRAGLSNKGDEERALLHHALDVVETLMERREVQFNVQLNPGDALLINESQFGYSFDELNAADSISRIWVSC